jgi:cell division protein FtsB
MEALRQRNVALVEEVAKVTDERDGLEQIHQEFREKYLGHPDSDEEPSENPLEKTKKQMEYVVTQNKKLIEEAENLRKKLKAL